MKKKKIFEIDKTMANSGNNIGYIGFIRMPTSTLDPTVVNHSVRNLSGITDHSMVDADPWTWVLSISLFTAAILTLLGNSMVVITFFMDKRLLRSNFNIFLLNLTVTDIAVSVTAIPLFGINYFYGEWPVLLGPYLCAIWMFCDWGMTFASVYTLVAISVDRYWAVCWSHHYRANNTRKRIYLMIAGVWIMVCVIWLPAFIHDQIISFSSEERDPGSCMWSITKNEAFAIFMAVGGYHIPTLIILFSYIRVFVIMRRSSTNLANERERRLKSEEVTLTVVSVSGATYDSTNSEYLSSPPEGRHVTIRDSDVRVVITDEDDEEETDLSSGAKEPLQAGSEPVTDSQVREATNIELTKLTTIDFDSLDTAHLKYGNKYKSTASLDIHCYTAENKPTNKLRVRPQSFTDGVTRLVNGHVPPRRSALCNTTVKAEVARNSRNLPGRARMSWQQRDYKLFVRVSYIIVAYLIFWTPFHVVFDLMLAGVAVPDHWYAFATLMCYLNSTINPLLYALGNPKMKVAFKNTLKCSRRK